VGLKRKDLLSLTNLSADDITLILETADSFKEVSGREIKKGAGVTRQDGRQPLLRAEHENQNVV
jgi:aspartate carbamoyltransferase catalytic subunit